MIIRKKYNLGGTNEDNNTTDMGSALGMGEKTKSGASEPSKPTTTNQSAYVTSTTPSPSAPKQPQQQKPARSGMFTNIKKYIERNRPSTVRMGQGLAQDAASRSKSIQDAIKKQQTDFRSRVEASRKKIEEAGQFGSEMVDTASNVISTPQVESQIKDINKRISNFQFTPDNDPRKYRANKAFADYEDFLKSYQQPTGDLNNQQLEDNLDFEKFVESQYGDNYDIPFIPYYNKVKEIADQRRNLQMELINLNNKLQNSPKTAGELAEYEQDIKRFNDLVSGAERYDNVLFNLSNQERATQDLMSRAQKLATLQGRREALRDVFGKRGSYTQGQSSLDNMLITNNQRLVDDIVKSASLEAKNAQEFLQDAYNKGRISQDQLRIENNKLAQDLQDKVSNAQLELEEGSELYRGLVKSLDEIEARLENGTYTEEDLVKKSEIENSMANYEGNVGLRGRARTGEGTFLRSIKDKIDTSFFYPYSKSKSSGEPLTDAELDYLGFKKDLLGEGTGYYNTSVSDKVNDMLRNIQIDPDTFGIQDVATLDDVARAQFLARLGGTSQEELDDYLLNEYGLGSSDLETIQDKYTMAEGDEYLTSKEELSSNDIKAITEISKAVGEDQQKVVDLMSNLKNVTNQMLKRERELKDQMNRSGWMGTGTYDAYISDRNRADSIRKSLLARLGSSVITSEGISDSDKFDAINTIEQNTKLPSKIGFVPPPRNIHIGGKSTGSRIFDEGKRFVRRVKDLF